MEAVQHLWIIGCPTDLGLSIIQTLGLKTRHNVIALQITITYQYPFPRHVGDEFPFPKAGYVSFVEAILWYNKT